MKYQTKRLEDFTDKDVIHCPTEELANKICKLLHDNGFKWSSGASYLEYNRWSSYLSNTCYRLNSGKYGTLATAKRNNCTIHKAEDILALYEEKQMKQNLEEYIVKCETAEESTITANFVKEQNAEN